MQQFNDIQYRSGATLRNGDLEKSTCTAVMQSSRASRRVLEPSNRSDALGRNGAEV
jgi:hypothetical protein